MKAFPARLGLGVLALAVLALTVAVAIGGGASQAQNPGDLLSVSPRDDQLRLIDPTDASTISSTPITLAGSTVNGATGLAVNPLTGDLWALLKIDGGGEPTPRELVTIDPATGVATSVGSLTDGFAGIAFDPAGTLYAVTGDGGTVSETLYTLSTSDGTATLVCALGNGTDGEAIAFNHSDGTLYHSSGHDGSDVIFETVDDTSVDPCGVTNIDVSATALEDEEAMALTYWPSAGELLWSQNHTDPPRLFSVTPAGVPTLIGDLDHVSKGLAILVQPATPTPSPSPTPAPTVAPTAAPTLAPTPTATPAQLPDTGAQPGGGSNPLTLAVIAAGLMAIAAGGFWVAKRVAVRP